MAKLNALTKAFNKCKAFCSKNSPFILVTGGVTLMVAGAVVACKETMKVEEIIDSHIAYKEKIDSLVEDKTEIHTDDGEVIVCDEEYSKVTKRKHTAYTIFRLVKNYAPAALLLIAGALCIFKGFNILNGRLADTTAALAASSTAFSKYRDYIRNTEGGEQLDKDAITGKHIEKFVDETIDENGNIVSKSTEEIKLNPNSDTAVIIDENSQIWKSNPQITLTNLRNTVESANYRILCRGYLAENEILETMGEPPIPAGQNKGWMSNRWNRNFPYGEGEHAYVKMFVNGMDITSQDFDVSVLEKPFCLDFNCAPELITPYL